MGLPPVTSGVFLIAVILIKRGRHGGISGTNPLALRRSGVCMYVQPDDVMLINHHHLTMFSFVAISDRVFLMDSPSTLKC
jgi:hypothetical protein